MGNEQNRALASTFCIYHGTHHCTLCSASASLPEGWDIVEKDRAPADDPNECMTCGLLRGEHRGGCPSEKRPASARREAVPGLTDARIAQMAKGEATVSVGEARAMALEIQSQRRQSASRPSAPSGELDAIGILTLDRDEWKRRATALGADCRNKDANIRDLHAQLRAGDPFSNMQGRGPVKPRDPCEHCGAPDPDAIYELTRQRDEARAARISDAELELISKLVDDGVKLGTQHAQSILSELRSLRRSVKS